MASKKEEPKGESDLERAVFWSIREEARLVVMQENVSLALEDIAKRYLPGMSHKLRRSGLYDAFIDGYMAERDLQRRENTVHTEKRVAEGVVAALYWVMDKKQEQDYYDWLEKNKPHYNG